MEKNEKKEKKKGRHYYNLDGTVQLERGANETGHYLAGNHKSAVRAHHEETESNCNEECSFHNSR